MPKNKTVFCKSIEWHVLFCLNWENRKLDMHFNAPHQSITQHEKWERNEMLEFYARCHIRKCLLIGFDLFCAWNVCFLSICVFKDVWNRKTSRLTLTSIKPRCSVLNPPMLANSSFISAVMWIFNAIKDMLDNRLFTLNAHNGINVSRSTFASRFHAAGCVNGVSKQAIAWHFCSNNSSHNGPSMCTASDLKCFGRSKIKQKLMEIYWTSLCRFRNGHFHIERIE